MTVDVLGPASLNAVTTRPTRTDVRGASNTWFKDCSSTTANDGTVVPADWLNDMLAQLRTAFTSAGIVLDNGDDMLWRAIQNVGIRFADDTGAVNALVVTNAVPVPAYRAGLALAVKTPNAPTGAATLNSDGLGVRAITRADGTALRGGEWSAGAVIFVIMDDLSPNNFRLIGTSAATTTGLTANLTYFVNAATGNDANTGLTPSTAFQHIQFALNFVSKLALNGFTVTINVADGNYSSEAPILLPRLTGTGIVQLIGDLTTPANCLVSSAAGPAFTHVVQGVVGYVVAGFKLASAGANSVNWPGSGMWISYGSSVQVYNLEFGACANACLHSQSGTIQVLGLDAPGGAGFLRLSGNAGQIFLAQDTVGTLALDGVAVTITTAITVSQFAMADTGGEVRAPSCTFTNPSLVTGQRYLSQNNAIIVTNGGGASYFPGTIGGSSGTNGGIYL